jgi:hypothetical protein
MAKPYGRDIAKQPGGASPQPPTDAHCATTAPVRLGPAKPGGNPRPNMNPYSGKK